MWTIVRPLGRLIALPVNKATHTQTNKQNKMTTPHTYTTRADVQKAKGGHPPTVTAYMSQVWDGEDWCNTSKCAMNRATATNEARVMRKFGDKARVIKLELGA